MASARWFAIVMAAGCRLRFDYVAGDAGGGDASNGDAAFGIDPSGPVALACNATTQLVPLASISAMPGTLSIASTTSGLVASWITDTGTVGAASIRLASPDSGDIVRLHDNLFGDAPGTRTLASIASNGNTVMVAALSTTGTTEARRFDVELTMPLDTGATGSPLDSTHGLAALAGTADYALASAAITGSVVERFRAGAATSSDGVSVAESYAEHALLALPQGVALVGAATQCETRLFDLPNATTGALVAWGMATMCGAGRLALMPQTNQLIAIRLSLTGGSHRRALGSITGTTIAIGAEGGPTYFSEVPVRVAATPGLFWTTRVLGDQMFYDAYDTSGATVLDTLSIEPYMEVAVDHDLAVRGSDPYAVWTGTGLWIGRLCP